MLGDAPGAGAAGALGAGNPRRSTGLVAGRGGHGVDGDARHGSDPAATFLAEIGDLSRFRTPHELMAYLGLVPRENSTGDKIKRAASPRPVTGAPAHAGRMRLELSASPAGGTDKQPKVDAAPPAVREIAWKAHAACMALPGADQEGQAQDRRHHRGGAGARRLHLAGEPRNHSYPYRAEPSKAGLPEGVRAHASEQAGSLRRGVRRNNSCNGGSGATARGIPDHALRPSQDRRPFSDRTAPDGKTDMREPANKRMYTDVFGLRSHLCTITSQHLSRSFRRGAGSRALQLDMGHKRMRAERRSSLTFRRPHLDAGAPLERLHHGGEIPARLQSPRRRARAPAPPPASPPSARRAPAPPPARA